MGRATQGVRLISLRGKDAIAAVCKVPKSDEEDELVEGAEGNMEGAAQRRKIPRNSRKLIVKLA